MNSSPWFSPSSKKTPSHSRVSLESLGFGLYILDSKYIIVLRTGEWYQYYVIPNIWWV